MQIAETKTIRSKREAIARHEPYTFVCPKNGHTQYGKRLTMRSLTIEGLPFPKKNTAVAAHHGVDEACHKEYKSSKGGSQPAQQLHR